MSEGDGCPSRGGPVPIGHRLSRNAFCQGDARFNCEPSARCRRGKPPCLPWLVHHLGVVWTPSALLRCSTVDPRPKGRHGGLPLHETAAPIQAIDRLDTGKTPLTCDQSVRGPRATGLAGCRLVGLGPRTQTSTRKSITNTAGYHAYCRSLLINAGKFAPKIAPNPPTAPRGYPPRCDRRKGSTPFPQEFD